MSDRKPARGQGPVEKPKKAAIVRRAKPRLADSQRPNQKYKKLSGTPAVAIVFRRDA